MKEIREFYSPYLELKFWLLSTYSSLEPLPSLHPKKEKKVSKQVKTKAINGVDCYWLDLSEC